MSAAPAVDRAREVRVPGDRQRLGPAGRAAPGAGGADPEGDSPRGGGPGIVVPDTYLRTTAVRAG
ncbi:hypothetical protein [Geodermatophilus poikilotrophus]|uniref:Uncharacterized protein n=1 Tax=Geodermatophilus poikilotrophus TaxID=1333667 RepID=A0A1I0I3Z6_9ACTN|nr:hypothetical protein [Geodermatophilus poikilotrophus]SET90432.1 hypothetical protein SAMN04488546_4128 [Geodermatophilus poikilotrophus]